MKQVSNAEPLALKSDVLLTALCSPALAHLYASTESCCCDVIGVGIGLGICMGVTLYSFTFTFFNVMVKVLSGEWSRYCQESGQGTVRKAILYADRSC